MRDALRYMVYGDSQTFDVERLIDLLQALEKFVAVRTGDAPPPMEPPTDPPLTPTDPH